MDSLFLSLAVSEEFFSQTDENVLSTSEDPFKNV